MSGIAQRKGAVARISRLLAWTAGFVLLLGCGLTTLVDVLARLLVGRSVLASFEISGYAFAIAIGLGSAYTVTTKGNVRIDFLRSLLPAGPARAFDLAAAILFAVAAVGVAWFAWETVAHSWKTDARSMSTLAVPLVIPQAVWWLGIAWFAFAAAMTAVHATASVVGRRFAVFDELAGVKSLSHEIHEAGVDVPASGVAARQEVRS